MSLGPFVISLPRLFLLLGLAAAVLSAYWLERRGDKSLDAPLWWSLLAGLIAARAGYVLTHLADYQAQPWQALYLWQDGYRPLLGVLATAVTASWFVWRRDYQLSRVFTPLAVGLLIWGGLGWVSQALTHAIERPLPTLAVEDLSGKPVSLASFQGQPVVLNLWASWCPPCRREMPVLAAAQEAKPGVRFLFINQGESAQRVRQYLSMEQLQLTDVLLDRGGDVARELSAAGLPTTLFFNAQGRPVDTHIGELSRARLGDYLRKLTAEEKQ